MIFSLSSALESTVRPGVLVFHGLRVVERDESLDALLLEVERRWSSRASPGGRPASAEADAVRAMYRAVGLDPTKRRPSSEALLRRVSRGEGFPRVNTLVDVCNWCSLEFQIPYGVYDLARVEGDVELRLGQPGEEYGGIRKDVVHIGGRLTLGDRCGPFGNPTADSARTMVTTATTTAMVVVYAPRLLPGDKVSAVLDATTTRIRSVAGGHETSRFVI